MPVKEILLSYLKVLIMYTKISSCLGIAQASSGVSHDCINRMLNGDWSGQTLFNHTLRSFFPPTNKGFLFLDDTVVIKSRGCGIYETCWAYSSSERRVVRGVSLVVLGWSDDKICIPINYRIYRQGGKTKTELALELLSVTRNRFKMKPEAVLFNSWYASKKILKRIRNDEWFFVCQLKKIAVLMAFN